jgi:hypothetical protein
VTVIEQILDRHQIEAQGYLDCQNILSGLGKANCERLEAACQELLNRGGQATYTTLKRLMAAINSDANKPRKIIPAPSTRKRNGSTNNTTSSGSGRVSEWGPDVYVRDASHYESYNQPVSGQGAGR